jgi:hypothetical protein
MPVHALKRRISQRIPDPPRVALLGKYETIRNLVKLLPEQFQFYRHACCTIFAKKRAALEAMHLEPDDKRVAAVLSGNDSAHIRSTSNHPLESAITEADEEIKLIESMIENEAGAASKSAI